MAQEEKPFYIRQLPKEAQDWLRDKAYKSFIADGDKEEDAQKKAEDFLDEKVYTAEEMYGKDFLNEVGKSEEPNAYDFLEQSEKVVNEKDPFEQKKLAGDLLKMSGGKQNALGQWEFEDEHGKYQPTESGRAIYSELKDNIDTNDNGKIDDDELDAYTKDLEDYLEKNPKAKDKNYY